MNGPEISIVIPVLNEIENIDELLAELRGALGSMCRTYEIIYVDDGSTDGSREKLTLLAEQDQAISVILFRRNYGQAAAFDAGFIAARGKIIVTLDADRQNDPADIPRMIQFMEENHLDFVSGIRSKRKDQIVSRKLPSLIANAIIRKVTRTRIRDLGCSLKVYKAEVVKEIRLYGEMHRFLAVLIEGTGAKVDQMSVNHRPRVAGVSKYGLARTFKVMLDLITVWFMRGFQTNPIYAFGGVSLLLFAGAVLLSLWTLYDKFVHDVFVHRNPLFILSMVMSILAVQFLAMGLIAEIMIRTYFESRGRPPYLVEKQKEKLPDPRIEVTIHKPVIEKMVEQDV